MHTTHVNVLPISAYPPMALPPIPAHVIQVSRAVVALLFLTVGLGLLAGGVPILFGPIGSGGFEPNEPYYPATPMSVPGLFVYSFNSNGTLEEAGSPSESTSPYWWLNSGGKLVINGGVGNTIQGELSPVDKWRILYGSTNPYDTDSGYHPQNLLRLVTKSSAVNVRAESLFKINKDNWSASSNRNGSNGLLMMTRYVDGSTLYYAGIRVDGTAVIKKKYHGTYYTMAQKTVFPGTYISGGHSNLLPHNEWVGLKSETVTNADGSVSVRLYMKRGETGAYSLLLEAKDSGQYGATTPIREAGRTGIRTDFMDVSFESFRMESF